MVTLQAFGSNSGRIAVGYQGGVKAANDKSEKAIQLDAGQSFSLRVTTVTGIYVDGTVTGDGFTYCIAPL